MVSEQGAKLVGEAHAKLKERVQEMCNSVNDACVQMCQVLVRADGIPFSKEHIEGDEARSGNLTKTLAEFPGHAVPSGISPCMLLEKLLVVHRQVLVANEFFPDPSVFAEVAYLRSLSVETDLVNVINPAAFQKAMTEAIDKADSILTSKATFQEHDGMVDDGDNIFGSAPEPEAAPAPVDPKKKKKVNGDMEKALAKAWEVLGDLPDKNAPDYHAQMTTRKHSKLMTSAQKKIESAMRKAAEGTELSGADEALMKLKSEITGYAVLVVLDCEEVKAAGPVGDSLRKDLRDLEKMISSQALNVEECVLSQMKEILDSDSHDVGGGNKKRKDVWQMNSSEFKCV